MPTTQPLVFIVITAAYTNSAAVKVASKNNEELMKYGFRPEDRRGKANRMGNPGRMNVRETALKQGGRLTAVRSDTTRIDGRMNAANGGWTQQYQQKPYHQFNAYKGNANPNTANLDIARETASEQPSRALPFSLEFHVLDKNNH